MYAFTCYVVLWNFSLVVLHDLTRWGGNTIFFCHNKDNKNHIHWLPSSINLLLLSMIFSQQLSIKVLYPLWISETDPNEKLSWPGTQHHRKKKKNLSLHISCGPHQNQNSAVGAETGPALWHSLARAPPKVGSPQQMGYSSIQFFSTAGWMHTLCHSTLQFLSNVSQQTAE